MDKNILFSAIKAAVKAGTQIMAVYNDPNADFEIEKKADNSPLTIADRKAHEVIASILSATPYPILSEEGRKIPVEERQGWNELWIVDPLDGTKEFIKRNGEFTVNIAYVKNGIPEAGVIYVPVKQELYFADCTEGAFKATSVTAQSLSEKPEDLMARSHRIPYPDKTKKRFMVVASRSHLTEDTARYIASMKEKHGEVETISIGSSLKLCLIAEGKADVYPRFAPTMEWDTAAGHAIVRAAGKEVYQAGTSLPLQYNKVDLLNPWFIAE